MSQTVDDEVLWIPAEQPEKRAVLHAHEGSLGLDVRCDDCGRTTRTTPATHLFVACAWCDGEISIRWTVGIA